MAIITRGFIPPDIGAEGDSRFRDRGYRRCSNSFVAVLTFGGALKMGPQGPRRICQPTVETRAEFMTSFPERFIASVLLRQFAYAAGVMRSAGCAGVEGSRSVRLGLVTG